MQLSGAGHPHSPDTISQLPRRCHGTLLRESRPPRELCGTEVASLEPGAPLRNERPLRLPGNVVARKALGNWKSIDPAAKPPRGVPQPSRPGCRGSRASLPSLGQGRFVPARPTRFSLPKKLPPPLPWRSQEWGGKAWAMTTPQRAAQEPPFQSPTRMREETAWGELSSGERLQKATYASRSGCCAWGSPGQPSPSPTL